MTTPFEATYATRRQALSNSRSSGGDLTLFIPTSVRAPLETMLAIKVTFKDCDATFNVVGKVSYLRLAARGTTQTTGVVVTFEGDHKKAASELLAFCAGRPLNEGTAGAPRRPAKFGCIVHTTRHALKAQVRDLSTTGAFVAAPEMRGFKEGMDVVLQLRPLVGTWGGRKVEARIMWVGEKYGETGFGARFTGEASDYRKTVKKLM